MVAEDVTTGEEVFSLAVWTNAFGGYFLTERADLLFSYNDFIVALGAKPGAFLSAIKAKFGVDQVKKRV